MPPIKVLLVQLASNGDCLFVTAVAKQIKESEYPGCHLTWMIGSRCLQVITDNPYIDAVIEIPLTTVEDIKLQRGSIPEHIAAAQEHTTFDHIFITDCAEINYHNWFGTTRSALFRSYPNQIKGNPQPIIFLSDAEKSNVERFCAVNNLTGNSYNILFECSPQSGQSRMTVEKAMDIAERLVLVNKNINFIISSNQMLTSHHPNIIDGSVISWKENAELANYCQLVVGCSSGISWLCTSSWTKPIPFIQVIDPFFNAGKVTASMKADFMYFGLSTKNLIELNNPPDNIIEECITGAVANQFQKVRRKYHSKDMTPFFNYNFLKESRIPFYKKGRLYLKYCRQEFLYKTYKSVKPTWFTPVAWAKKLKSIVS